MVDSAIQHAYVRLTDPALDDLEHLVAVDPQILRWALESMLLLEREPDAGQPLLGDLIGWHKLTVDDRDWRIVWRVTTDQAGNQALDIAEVWADGARADAEVYAEMNERVASLGNSAMTHALSEVIARLGRAAGKVTAAAERVQDPVPQWLADRLIHQLRMTANDVAGMTGAQAIQYWEAFITRTDQSDRLPFERPIGTPTSPTTA